MSHKIQTLEIELNTLLQKREDLRMERDGLVVKRLMQLRSMPTERMTVSCCGSTIALEYLRDLDCPVCGEKRTFTTVKLENKDTMLSIELQRVNSQIHEVEQELLALK